MMGRSGASVFESQLKRPLVLPLVAPDLLAGKTELLGDGLLRHVLDAGIGDGPAELKTRCRSLRSRCHVRVPGRDNVSHRIRHLAIMTRMWPLVMMPHCGAQRNWLRCHNLGGMI